MANQPILENIMETSDIIILCVGIVAWIASIGFSTAFAEGIGFFLGLFFGPFGVIMSLLWSILQKLQQPKQYMVPDSRNVNDRRNAKSSDVYDAKSMTWISVEDFQAIYHK